ncbi:MAG: bis(5'-nucleosyl)-tetraphosphatase (symmetrical) YqeK [Candidatus Sericytochromatia bacterium]|nr:bis(5'-nucleosyl)-tetraphosphatase (symmetrical) YqeK [Candidatus Sericytochromatia bacterium]
MKEIEKLQRRLKDMVPAGVYEHSLRVQQRCVELASHYGVDTNSAAIAGLLHDVAKRHSADELIYLAEQDDLPITELVLTEPVAALHGVVGAAIIGREFGVTDREVLLAVQQHALGGEEMSALSKILYLADKTEAERTAPEIEAVRALCAQNLDEALVAAFDMMIRTKLNERSLILEQLVRSRNKAVLKLRRSD